MKKFLFDTHNFDKKDEAPPAPTFSEEQMEDARKDAHAQGKSAAREEAKNAVEQDIARILEKIGADTATLAATEDQRNLALQKQAVQLALQIVHKILPRFAADNALNEIEGVILSALDTRRDEPRIAVTVPTQFLEHLRPRIDAIAIERGFAGKVILLADDAMSASDCRIEWADGGVERLYERLYSQIEAACAETIAGIDKTLEKKDPAQPQEGEPEQ